MPRDASITPMCMCGCFRFSDHPEFVCKISDPPHKKCELSTPPISEIIWSKVLNMVLYRSFDDLFVKIS